MIKIVQFDVKACFLKIKKGKWIYHKFQCFLNSRVV